MCFQFIYLKPTFALQSNINMPGSERWVWGSGFPLCYHIRGLAHLKGKHEERKQRCSLSQSQICSNFQEFISFWLEFHACQQQQRRIWLFSCENVTSLRLHQSNPSKTPYTQILRGHNRAGSSETCRSCRRRQPSRGGGQGPFSSLQTFRWITPFQQCKIAMDESTRNHAKTQPK